MSGEANSNYKRPESSQCYYTKTLNIWCLKKPLAWNRPHNDTLFITNFRIQISFISGVLVIINER